MVLQGKTMVKVTKNQKLVGRPPINKVQKPYLKKIVESMGGVAKFAEKIKKASPTVSAWIWTTRKISADNCILIEKATRKAIKRWDLRPDLFREDKLEFLKAQKYSYKFLGRPEPITSTNKEPS